MVNYITHMIQRALLSNLKHISVLIIFVNKHILSIFIMVLKPIEEDKVKEKRKENKIARFLIEEREKNTLLL